MKILRLGMDGLDTSHVRAFANLLHKTDDPLHVPGGRIVAAFPGGSADFEKSISRVEGFTSELREKHGVEIVSSLSGLRGRCDAIMLESIDGRVHLGQFREVADWGVPVFIDKPLAISAAEAREIARIAREKNVRVSSASAVRYAMELQDLLTQRGGEPIISADFYGPMPMEAAAPGYFWYGLHAVEMLYGVFGGGCRDVLAMREGENDVIMARWQDGRVGVIRGNRSGNNCFGGVLHRRSGSVAFSVGVQGRPFYVSLLERVIPFLRGEADLVPLDEMVEVIAFIEAANRSVETGLWTVIR